MISLLKLAGKYLRRGESEISSYFFNCGSFAQKTSGRDHAFLAKPVLRTDCEPVFEHTPQVTLRNSKDKAKAISPATVSLATVDSDNGIVVLAQYAKN